MEARAALIVGATGLVGRACLARLLETHERVTALVRRPTGTKHERLTEVVVDFDALAPSVVTAQDVFCCLGTTIKAAGSQAAFRKVDHELVVTLARHARANGSERMGLVSSVGADPASGNFYLRTKGEAERDVAALGFACLEVLRPSFLVGERAQKRTGEELGIAVASGFSFVLAGGLRKYRPVEAEKVGRALVAAVLRGEPGTHVRHFDEIVALAREPVSA